MVRQSAREAPTCRARRKPPRFSLQALTSLPSPGNLVAEQAVLKTKVADLEANLEQTNYLVHQTKALAEGVQESEGYDDSDLRHKYTMLSQEVAVLKKTVTAVKKQGMDVAKQLADHEKKLADHEKKLDTSIRQSCKATDDISAMKRKTTTTSWGEAIFKAEQEKLKKEMAILRGVLKKIVKAGPAHREAAFEGAAQEIDTGVSWADQADDEPVAVEPEGDEDDDGAGVSPRPKRTGAAAARKRAKPTE